MTPFHRESGASTRPATRGDFLLPRGKVLKTTIFYFTGTGNSLWVARTLAQELGDAEVVSMAACRQEKKTIEAKGIGLVFPVHIWGVPRLVLEFVEELKGLQPAYVFAVAVNAGQVANTLVQLKRVLKQDGLNLSTGFEIPLPSNYIPWGGPGPKEKQNQRFSVGQEKDIRNRRRHKRKRGKAGGKRPPLAEVPIFAFL